MRGCSCLFIGSLMYTPPALYNPRSPCSDTQAHPFPLQQRASAHHNTTQHNTTQHNTQQSTIQHTTTRPRSLWRKLLSLFAQMLRRSASSVMKRPAGEDTQGAGASSMDFSDLVQVTRDTTQTRKQFISCAYHRARKRALDHNMSGADASKYAREAYAAAGAAYDEFFE